MKEGEFFRQIWISRIFQLREHFLRELLGSDQNLLDLADNCFQKLEIALFRVDHALSIPLIDVGGVIVVKEAVFANRAYIGADAFAGAAVELF